MFALSVTPGKSQSGRLEEDWPEPFLKDGEILVETLSIGICGTDREILAGKYGISPSGEEKLIIGHESLGRVLDAPASSRLSSGDLVVAIVRHPDPVPCANCAIGEWDMCRNGLYTEHGIKERHGFGRERFRCGPESFVKIPSSLESVGVLVETASILAKAWEHIDYIGRRAVWHPRNVLVLGSGPVGLLAALMGVQRGLSVEVFDKVTSGPKLDLVRSLGARYSTGPLKALTTKADIVIECTGDGQLVYDVMGCSSSNGIICLTGISSGSRLIPANINRLNENIVLGNDVIFGSVNANRRHYEAAVAALSSANRSWLEKIITKKVPLRNWQQAFERGPDDIKNVILLR